MLSHSKTETQYNLPIFSYWTYFVDKAFSRSMFPHNVVYILVRTHGPVALYQPQQPWAPANVQLSNIRSGKINWNNYLLHEKVRSLIFLKLDIKCITERLVYNKSMISVCQQLYSLTKYNFRSCKCLWRYHLNHHPFSIY